MGIDIEELLTCRNMLEKPPSCCSVIVCTPSLRRSIRSFGKPKCTNLYLLYNTLVVKDSWALTRTRLLAGLAIYAIAIVVVLQLLLYPSPLCAIHCLLQTNDARSMVLNKSNTRIFAVIPMVRSAFVHCRGANIKTHNLDFVLLGILLILRCRWSWRC